MLWLWIFIRLSLAFPTILFFPMIVTSVELRDSLRFISFSSVQLAWIMFRWSIAPSGISSNSISAFHRDHSQFFILKIHLDSIA